MTCRAACAIAWAVALTVAAPAARAQSGAPVRLRIRPAAGDTFPTRFEQDVTMSGVTKVHGRDTTLTTTTSTLVLARVVVQTSDAAGCTLLVITDSVATLNLGSQALALGETARRAMQGRRFLLRVAPDGSSQVMRTSSELEPELGSFAYAMPSVLPGGPVDVGAVWENAMAVPVRGEAAPAAGAPLRVRYRFDSLGAGDLAYVSLRGRMVRDSASAPVKGGARLGSRGDVVGSLVLDRRRGWWAESRVTITLRSVITPAPGNDAPPVRVETRITQRLYTEPAAGAPR